MKLRRTLFLLSILLHLICIYWIAHLNIPLLLPPEEERVIDIVPVSVDRILFPADFQPWTGGTGKMGKKETSGLPSPTRAVKRAVPSRNPEAAAAGQVETAASPPPLKTPSLEVDKIPELSIYSKDMQDLLKKYEPGRNGRGGIGFAAGSRGGGEGGSLNGHDTAAQNRIFFNTPGYDLVPWSKRVLLSVQRNWRIPLVTRKKVKRPVEVTTLIEKNGKITSLTVKVSSNSDAFDLAAVNALRLSSPLPGLPEEFPDNSLEARFMFTYSEQ